MTTPASAKAQLEQQLARLLNRVGKIENDLRRVNDPNWTEQAIALENDQVLEGLDEMTLAEVRQIRAALARIAENAYGTCERCGGPIAPERLASIPSTTLCVGCARSSPRPA